MTCAHGIGALAAELSGREDSVVNLGGPPPPKPGLPRAPVGKVKLVPLDQTQPEKGKKPVELVRLDSGDHRPDRDTVNEILGWKKGKYKVVLLAQEIDNTEAPAGSSRMGRLTHKLFVRPATAVGILKKRHLHVSVAFIDPDGKWFRANPTGPLAPIQETGFLSRDVAYVPLDLSDGDAKKAAEGIKASIGGRSPFGCANGSCQTVANALDADKPSAQRRKFPMTASYSLSKVIDEGLLPASDVFVTGTGVDSFHAFHRGLLNADWNAVAPLVLPMLAGGL
jgi:hypothetical protein